jgi:phosphate-selective porin OprO/OprP
MSQKKPRRWRRPSLLMLAVAGLLAQRSFAQQPVGAAPSQQPAASQSTISSPWSVAPAGSPNGSQIVSLPPVQLTPPDSILDPLPDVDNRQLSMQEIQRRLERTEAELAELHAQSSAAANGGPNARFTSLQQGSGTTSKGVEDRIRSAEQNQLSPSSGAAGAQNGSGQTSKGVEDRIRDLESSAKALSAKLPLVRLSGFMQVDNVDYTQDAASQTTYGTMQDGTGFRRARLQALGKVTDFTNFSIEMDFASAGRPSFLDVWGEQQNLGWLGTIRVGQFRQPTTMDSWTSVRHLEFLERSNAFQAMDPFRRVGIMSYNITESQRTTWAASVYRTGFTFLNPTTGVENSQTLSDDRFATFVGNSGGWSTAYRMTHLLFYDDLTDGRTLLHVGAGYNYSNIGGNGGAPSSTNGHTYDGRSIPGVFVGDPQTSGITANGTPFVTNTGLLPAKSFDYWHTEFAGQYGPAHFQTEFLATQLNTIGFGQALLTGLYFQSGYFLTGEQAGYNKQQAVMDYNVNPYSQFFGLGNGRGICGWGAWEVAYRFDYTDMPYVVGAVAPPSAASVKAGTTNAGTSSTNPNPGELYQNTFALNWWWNQFTRVQFNYINVYNQGTFAVYGNSHTSIYATRFQIEF